MTRSILYLQPSRFRILVLATVLIAFGLCLVAQAPAFAALVQDDIEQLEEEAIQSAVDSVAPSVIRFETIGGTTRVEGAIVANGPATGLVISEDGFVLSASFHFAHKPASILAKLPNGKTASAEIVGRDLSRKIVLLKVRTETKFTVPQFAKTDSVSVGQTVVAIGRVFDSANTNVSTGIVSAMNRVWDRAIQTDAKISPANFGGPLTGLDGKVIGVLVPMSPDDDSELAGTEWYDSGIGFAVPISNILERLEQLKSGKTLRPGLLGVSIKGSDVYADPAVVGFCGGSSPAWKAGVRADDEIVEINGRKITRQSEMKHALGALYENDEVDIVVKRDGKTIPMKVKLAGEIESYQPVAIGALLKPGTNNLTIARVFKDSPAKSSGLQPDDQIESVDDQPVENSNDLRLKIAATELDAEIQLGINRNGKAEKIQINVGKQTAKLFATAALAQKRKSKLVEIKVADASNDCFAIVPQRLDDEPEPALLVWIPTPGKKKKEDIEKVWLGLSKNQNVVVLIPQSNDKKRWQPDEADFIVSAIDNLKKQFPFDPDRVVIGGSKSGGTMASVVAFSQRDLFRGIALLDSKISTRIGNPITSPVEPMLIYISGKPSEDAASSIKRLETAKFPVHFESNDGNNFQQRVEKILTWTKTTSRL